MKTIQFLKRLGGAFLLALFIGGVARAEANLEHEIKAAYLFKFVTLTDWPAGALPPDGHPITLGVYGKNPFGNALSPLDGKVVKGRVLRVKEVSSPAEAKLCQIVFISPSERAQFPELIRELTEARVLTVGADAGFAASGGIINFFEERNKIRFEINQDASRRIGFNISSEVLKLARLVKG